MKHTYYLENLNCAHCAAKIETKIAQTEGYDNVSFNFATKKLNFEHESDNLVAEIQAICDEIEDGVTVSNNNARHAHHSHEHHHHDHCDCDGHEHGHAHEHHHEHGESNLTDKILLAVSVGLGVSALTLHLTLTGQAAFWTVLVVSLAATLCAGYKVFLKGIKNLFKLNIEETVLITIAVIAAFFLQEFVEAAMVTILFAVGEFIEDIAVDRSRHDIEKLSQIRPDTATVLENGSERIVAAENVAIGSLIVVKPHERVPLDGEIVEGHSTLDNAALTGESLQVNAVPGTEVLSGAINGDGLLTVKTTKVFGDSTATRILRLVEDAAAQKGKREKLITRFANIYTPIVIALAVLIAAVPPLLGFGSFAQWLYKALVVLVASCPCAIVISVPLAYYSGIGAGSRIGVLIKGGRYLEALAKADTFAFDKTGTLTIGKMTVSNVYTYEGYSEAEVLSLAAACEKYSAHPIALAIQKTANGKALEMTNYREIAGCGTSAEYEGKTIACGNARLIDGKLPDELQGKNTVLVVYDGKLIGALEISDTLDEKAPKMLQQLKQLGIQQTLMLTGDTAENAESVRSQLGNIQAKAQLMPQDKLDIISELQDEGHTVCFVGDGINDAPVLSKSDCGVAMGFGSEAALEAADVALSSGDLTSLPKAVKLARKTMNTIRANIIFALAVKAAVILLAFFGMAAMWMSVLADTGVSVVCVLYTARLLKTRI